MGKDLCQNKWKVHTILLKSLSIGIIGPYKYDFSARNFQSKPKLFTSSNVSRHHYLFETECIYIREVVEKMGTSAHIVRMTFVFSVVKLEQVKPVASINFPSQSDKVQLRVGGPLKSPLLVAPASPSKLFRSLNICWRMKMQNTLSMFSCGFHW